jgi:type I restriction enzyme M protein
VVNITEIAENDYNLNIRRYADTSPPPEIFDVRALLHGGVPVREVHDDYIQEEIIKGFDLSVVFIKRDDDYYDFKADITSKELIRTFLSTENQALISQVERWWDKYRISLHELEEQVVQAETVLKGFLAELGYD